MNRQEAREILPLVNDPENMRMLNVYLDWKIEQTRDELETAVEISRVSELQGRVRELRRMKELDLWIRDWASKEPEVNNEGR